MGLREHPLTRAGLSAFLGVPLRDHTGTPFGALMVFDRCPQQWSEPDAVTLLQVADLLSTALRWEDQPP